MFMTVKNYIVVNWILNECWSLVFAFWCFIAVGFGSRTDIWFVKSPSINSQNFTFARPDLTWNKFRKNVPV